MNFYLPDFYKRYKLNVYLIDLIRNHPEFFYENINVPALYGTFPGAIWNGGRRIIGISTQEEIVNTVLSLNANGIKLRYTFTNSEIEEKHLSDTYCNMIMDISNNGFNEILVNSKILENYLRKNYPNFKYIYSTTNCERDVNNLNNLCLNYDLVVMDYRDNTNFDLLSKLTQKEKIEILLNAYCDPNCKNRLNHYKNLSLQQLNFSNSNYEAFNCGILNRSFLEALDFPTVIKENDLYELYINHFKFNNFKIEGRLTNDIDVIESYVYYLVKPIYKDRVRNLLLKTAFL